MRVSGVGLVPTGDSCELRATVHTGALRQPFDLWYRFPREIGGLIDPDSGDFLVPALLLAAMARGEPLAVPCPVSPALKRSLREIQTIFHMWDSTLQAVPVNAPVQPGASRPSREVGLFFSLGIDSQYTLWKNVVSHPLDQEVITHLIMVYGADLYLADGMEDVFAQMSSNTRAIAAMLGRQVICVSTNLGDFLAALHIRRGFLGHESILASVGLALSPMFKMIYVATGSSYIDLAPSNAHPLLSPLWSTESCRFICDGLEAGRVEKTRFLVQSPQAMNTLRVCWLQEGLYNCGECSKCVRTMLALHAVGALGKCRTLPESLDLERLKRLRLVLDYDLIFLQEILDNLGDSAVDGEIRRVLRDVLAEWQVYFQRVARARKNIDRLIAPGDRFILVDRDTIRWTLGSGRAAVPFLEKEGKYWGVPADDESAISELERLRAEGVGFIAFWWTDYWWLQYYSRLNDHLRSRYRCLLEDDCLIVFDLRQPGRPQPKVARGSGRRPRDEKHTRVDHQPPSAVMSSGGRTSR